MMLTLELLLPTLRVALALESQGLRTSTFRFTKRTDVIKTATLSLEDNPTCQISEFSLLILLPSVVDPDTLNKPV